MKYWEAMREVDSHRKMRRTHWGRADYVSLSPVFIGGTEYLKSTIMVTIVMKNGDFAQYTPTNCDMVADDWEIV